jgi:hypothetical protein
MSYYYSLPKYSLSVAFRDAINLTLHVSIAHRMKLASLISLHTSGENSSLVHFEQNRFFILALLLSQATKKKQESFSGVTIKKFLDSP